MTKVQKLIEQCRRRGVALQADENGLVVSGPMDAALMQRLREHRDAIERELLAARPVVVSRLWRSVMGSGSS